MAGVFFGVYFFSTLLRVVTPFFLLYNKPVGLELVLPGSLVGILAFIITLILLFAPGKKGDTEFWKDPMGTKLGLLG